MNRRRRGWIERSRAALLCGTALLMSLEVAAGPGSAAEPRVVDMRELTQQPKLRSQVQPTYPAALRAQGLEGIVTVEFLVLPDGTVGAPSVVGEANPLFSAAALAAVAQWEFEAARVGQDPVATKVRVPIRFALTPGDPGSIKVAIGPLSLTRNMRTGEQGVVVHIQAEGAGGADVQAGRVTLIRAEDDTGAILKQGETPAFRHSSVGRVAGDNADVSVKQPIAITLMGLGKEAKTVKQLEAKLELFVPSRDPDATVVVAGISSLWGTPLASEALEKAGVTLVVFDQTTAKTMSEAKTPGGPQDYDNGSMFVAGNLDPALRQHLKAANEGRQKMYDSLSPELAARLRASHEMQATDVAIGWYDPQHRIIGVEFQAADGKPLRYNHNGRFHSERTEEQKGFDIYDLRVPVPPDARLVCWLLTEESVVPVPLKLNDLPLPPAAPRVPPPEPTKPAGAASSAH